MSARDTAGDESLHPRAFRLSILLAAFVAIAVWWGLGLPYSTYAWLLDDQQLRWTLICYAWEVPAAGLLGPVLVPQIWWRRVERRWDRVFADHDRIDPAEAARLEGMILDYPIRVAWVLLATSLVGYAVGALQLRLFAQLPLAQIVHVCLLGIVTGLVGGLFAFLYLERLLPPLLRDLCLARPTVPPAGRRVPIRTKVFACAVVIMVCTVPLFGTVFWNESARMLEQQVGRQLLLQAGAMAARDLAGDGFEDLVTGVELGRAGRAYVVDAAGTVVAGHGGIRRLAEEGFRPRVLARILTGPAGHLVDRTYAPRVVAFAPVARDGRRLIVIVPEHQFSDQLLHGLRTAGGVFVAVLALALAGGYLFARRLSRPIEIVTAVAHKTAETPDTPYELTAVRTNDEVGELAVALNRMTTRLGEARDALARHSAELEDRVAAATRNVTTLYETTRSVTSTLEVDDVLRLIEEKIVAAFALPGLVLLRYAPLDAHVEAYATGHGRLDIGPEVDLRTVAHGSMTPTVRPLAEASLPAAVRDRLTGPDVLCLPLLFKDLLLGLIVASVDRAAPLDLELAAALASQVAVALANASLFEAVRRHETELRELSERQEQLREEALRSLSRELHDGLGQALTAIKIDLGLIERVPPGADVPALRSQVHAVQVQVTEVIQEVRRISQLLRPSTLDDLGLVPSLRSLVESVATRSGIAIRLRTPKVEQRLPPAIEVLLYRVTQEALTNIVRHARAAHGSVELVLAEDQATLRISDDGVGFDMDRLRRTPTLGGVGLLGMRERVGYHGGRIDVRTRPGEGVRIVLTIPIAADEPRLVAPLAGRS